jgi:hypothetical protein
MCMECGHSLGSIFMKQCVTLLAYYSFVERFTHNIINFYLSIIIFADKKL